VPNAFLLGLRCWPRRAPLYLPHRLNRAGGIWTHGLSPRRPLYYCPL